MRKLFSIAGVALALTLGMAWGQDSSAQGGGQTSPPPTPAYGQDVPGAADNPPITGTDLPGLEPHAAPLSYLQLGGHFTESADTNATGSLGSGNGVHSVTRALGSVELQRLWSRYDLALDYVGGVGYYNTARLGFEQLHSLNVDQRVLWKRGQFSVKDYFSYLPEGNFAGPYGSSSTNGEALSGIPFLPGMFQGGLGQVPRIMNSTTAEVTQNLTAKSAVTALGGYTFVHYTGDNPGVQGIPFLGSSEVMAQTGYNRVLGPHDQVAISYGYQGFKFKSPSASALLLDSSFHTHVVQLMWGHRISGRMNFLLSAGPQFTALNLFAPTFPPNSSACVISAFDVECPVSNVRLSVAGRAMLNYRFKRYELEIAYQRYTSAGSGFFPGSNTDAVHAGVSHPINRVWTVFGDLGVSHNSRIRSLSAPELAECQLNQLACPGVTASKYLYGYAGIGVHRQLGHDFRVYASYQFNELSFDSSFCLANVPGSACSRISNRQFGLIGLDWTPRPMRLD